MIPLVLTDSLSKWKFDFHETTIHKQNTNITSRQFICRSRQMGFVILDSWEQ